jgi:hypothetical protein
MSVAIRHDDPRSRLYEITAADAGALLGASGLPVDLRREILAHYAKENGAEALVALFANFIGLANSVVANCHDALEIFGMAHLGMHPYEAEKLNLPTIDGALFGVRLTAGVEVDGICDGCAFRLGSHANQSPLTTCDADFCSHPGEVDFMCHEALDDKGAPTKGCAGWARKRAMMREKAGTP